jgi:hypothetical protein
LEIFELRGFIAEQTGDKEAPHGNPKTAEGEIGGRGVSRIGAGIERGDICPIEI